MNINFTGAVKLVTSEKHNLYKIIIAFIVWNPKSLQCHSFSASCEECIDMALICGSTLKKCISAYILNLSTQGDERF